MNRKRDAKIFIMETVHRKTLKDKWFEHGKKREGISVWGNEAYKDANVQRISM